MTSTVMSPQYIEVNWIEAASKGLSELELSPSVVENKEVLFSYSSDSTISLSPPIQSITHTICPENIETDEILTSSPNSPEFEGLPSENENQEILLSVCPESTISHSPRLQQVNPGNICNFQIQLEPISSPYAYELYDNLIQSSGVLQRSTIEPGQLFKVFIIHFGYLL